MPIKYIGRTHYFQGKTLWEIVGNLKNYGVGRVVVRSVFERYPENSWMRILKVTPEANPANPGLDNFRKVRVLVERVFRGRKYPNPVEIFSVSYKTDYRLLSKSEEASYCKVLDEKSTTLPPLPLETQEFPPLLKELLKQQGETNPQLQLSIKSGIANRRAPPKGVSTSSTDVPVNLNFGTPVALRLYENVLQ